MPLSALVRGAAREDLWVLSAFCRAPFPWLLSARLAPTFFDGFVHGASPISPTKGLRPTPPRRAAQVANISDQCWANA